MRVVKMAQGGDRVRAASFAWESTAFPMLTGTLVTAAGFLPIGFASSAVGEYTGSIFWIVAIALVASWFVAVIFTPYIGVKLLPNMKAHHNHDPHAVYETRMYRGLRAIVQWFVGHRITGVVATVGIFIASIVAMAWPSSTVSPSSTFHATRRRACRRPLHRPLRQHLRGEAYADQLAVDFQRNAGSLRVDGFHRDGSARGLRGGA
ncbi:hypothetical protein E4T56_gene8604, partial [Termitomyces sp. T112]